VKDYSLFERVKGALADGTQEDENETEEMPSRFADDYDGLGLDLLDQQTDETVLSVVK